MAERVLVTEEPDTSAASLRRSSSLRATKSIVCDNLSHGRKKAVPAAAKAHSCRHRGPRRAGSNFSGTPHRRVMHFAAFIEAGESMQVPEKYFRNNTVNSLTLLEAMLVHKVQRLVFS